MSPRKKLDYAEAEYPPSPMRVNTDSTSVDLGYRPTSPAFGSSGNKPQKTTKKLNQLRRTVSVKQIAKQGRKVGQGIATISIARNATRPKKPPTKEPKLNSSSAKAGWRSLKERAINRRMKRMGKRQSRSAVSDTMQDIAGELSTFDNTCRTASNVVSQISVRSTDGDTNDAQSALWDFLWGQVAPVTKLDKWFLQGTASQVSRRDETKTWRKKTKQSSIYRKTHTRTHPPTFSNWKRSCKPVAIDRFCRRTSECHAHHPPHFAPIFSSLCMI